MYFMIFIELLEGYYVDIFIIDEFFFIDIFEYL